MALVAIETERHVAGGGWDQPPRLFALVPSADLAAREPQLAVTLDLSTPGALTAIEQEDIPTGTGSADVTAILAQIGWPDEVAGAALVIERVVLPPGAEPPADATMHDVLHHPQRRDIRLLAAALRSGESVCLLRQRDHDADDMVAVGDDIAPGLVAAVRATLADDDD